MNWRQILKKYSYEDEMNWRQILKKYSYEDEMNWRQILKKYSYKNTYPNGDESRELQKTEVILEMYEGPELYEKGRAIRKFCLDCAGGSNGEVLLCHSFSCPLYPYRLGTNTRSQVINKGINADLYLGPNNYDEKAEDGLEVTGKAPGEVSK